MEAHSLGINDSFDQAVEELTPFVLTTLVGVLPRPRHSGFEPKRAVVRSIVRRSKSSRIVGVDVASKQGDKHGGIGASPAGDHRQPGVTRGLSGHVRHPSVRSDARDVILIAGTRDDATQATARALELTAWVPEREGRGALSDVGALVWLALSVVSPAASTSRSAAGRLTSSTGATSNRTKFWNPTLAL
jgi:hypothetical protein